MSKSVSGKGLKTGTGKVTVSVGKPMSTSSQSKTQSGESSSAKKASTETQEKGTGTASGRGSVDHSYQNGPIVGHEGHRDVVRDGMRQFLLPEGASYYIVPCSMPPAAQGTEKV